MPKSSSSKRPAPDQTDLRWLARYARHCGLTYVSDDALSQSLRHAFGAAAWRLVCRSPKSCFMPILRNQELSIHSLIRYCQELAERSFVQAPQPVLLAYFVRQRRLYQDRPCRIPEDDDYDLIRVANRHTPLVLRDIACVMNWAHQSRTAIQPGHKWRNLVMRARKYNALERIELASQSHAKWHFFCTQTDWLGYKVNPILDEHALWQQGQRQGNCLYKLRYECTQLMPSRFFSISKAGRALATLELIWRAPQASFKGMDRVWGRWELQDLRLSYNRLPDQKLLDAMQSFAVMYNTWAKRPGRLPVGYADDLRQRLNRLNSNGHWSDWRPSLLAA